MARKWKNHGNRRSKFLGKRKLETIREHESYNKAQMKPSYAQVLKHTVKQEKTTADDKKDNTNKDDSKSEIKLTGRYEHDSVLIKTAKTKAKKLKSNEAKTNDESSSSTSDAEWDETESEYDSNSENVEVEKNGIKIYLEYWYQRSLETSTRVDRRAARSARILVKQAAKNNLNAKDYARLLQCKGLHLKSKQIGFRVKHTMVRKHANRVVSGYPIFWKRKVHKNVKFHLYEETLIQKIDKWIKLESKTGESAIEKLAMTNRNILHQY
ncbi:MAG: hypothetical protein ACPG2Y_03430, partial [Acholeplasmataceae bacterium]